jgi:two-component system LytT family response regulator
VFWIAAAGNYVELHTAARAILHRIALNRLVEHLDPAHFLRVHRGAVVRFDQLAGLATIGEGSHEVRLLCRAKVTVSERYVKPLREAMAGR